MNTPAQHLLQVARSLFAAKPDARTFWNSLFGVGAIYGQLLPTQAEREAFDLTPESREIHEMLYQLPDPDLDVGRGLEADAPELRNVLSRANGALNVHVPRSLHAALIIEAQKEGVSLDELCATKLGTKLSKVLAQ